jgi:two-component system sensor histidine kinase DctS
VRISFVKDGPIIETPAAGRQLWTSTFLRRRRWLPRAAPRLERMTTTLLQPPPLLAAPPQPRGVWAWPFLLALTFAAAVAGWLQWSDEQEREEERRTLITDVLSLESRITDWLAAEETALAGLAKALPDTVNDATLQREFAVAEGLRRVWVSVTVIDADNRLLAHVPQQAPRPASQPLGGSIDDGGLSAHLAAPLRGGGRLIVRFAPASLLRQTVPWWLSRKYDVRLVDDYGQRIAATDDALPAAGRQSYRVSIEPQMNDTFLELTTRALHVPWWRTLPLALMAVFLLLSAAASWTLRRQMREVANAEGHWRTEAAWRRAIEDSLTVGLRGRDIEGRLVHVNRAFCDMVGFTPKQLLGQLPPMPYWLPDAMENSMQRHRRNMAGNAPREGYEARFLRCDGAVIDVMIFEAPLVDARGHHMGWMGSIVDITARKRSEERERRQLETLGNQARLTTLGEVASALAHQLNQPLAALAGYNAGVLRSLECMDFADTAVLDAMRRSNEQVAEAGRIVKRIRGFLTRHAPQREPCAIDDIVQRVLTVLRRDLQHRSIRVETRLAPGLPAVLADPVLVEQVLINLVRNAADALATSTEPHVRVTASLAGGRFVRVDVDDNGSGLGGRGIDELAAPFHSTKPDGMGMGLAICRSVIEAHHGALEAGNSALGGARLSFTLPVAEPEDDQ